MLKHVWDEYKLLAETVDAEVHGNVFICLDRRRSWQLQRGWSCQPIFYRQQLGRVCAGAHCRPIWRCRGPFLQAGWLDCSLLSVTASSQTLASSSRCTSILDIYIMTSS